jgi:CRP-like cAMP-binding protein
MEEPEVLSAAAVHPLLSTLDAPALRAVVRASKLVRYREKRPVLREGDPPDQAFCLLRGAVRVFHRSGESEVLLKLFRAPALFGEMEVLAVRPFMEYVTTLEPSEILHVPSAVFTSAMRNHPAFAQALAIDLAARLCISAHNQKALAFCDVDTRLANLLLDYAQFFGIADGAGVRLTVSLSQESMAHDLAVTRKALGVALNKLREEGILTKEEARFVIRDIDALSARSSNTLRLSFQSGPVGANRPLE